MLKHITRCYKLKCYQRIWLKKQRLVDLLSTIWKLLLFEMVKLACAHYFVKNFRVSLASQKIRKLLRLWFNTSIHCLKASSEILYLLCSSRFFISTNYPASQCVRFTVYNLFAPFSVVVFYGNYTYYSFTNCQNKKNKN